MISRAVLGAFAAACAGLLIACGGDDDDASSNVCGVEGCSAECEQLRGDNCDILEAGCRQRIFDAVSCVRGTSGEMPAVRTLTEDEYRAELLAEIDSDDEDAGAEDDSSDQTWSRGLTLLGLIASDETLAGAAIDDLVSGLAGQYDGASRTITLIDRDRAEDSDDAQATLAHELVHALQDQDFGLAELSDRNGGAIDAFFARTCLIEGEASLYEDLAVGLLQGFDAAPSYWDVALTRRLKYARRSVAITESPYAALWHLNYPVGTRFVTDAWLAGGNRDVHGLYWAPPQSTIHFMRGYAALLEHEGQLVRPLACNDAAAPEGFVRSWETSMGPFPVYGFLAHALVDEGIYPSEAAWQDALLWRQDSLSIFSNEVGEVAVSWRVLFESAELAERLASKLPAVLQLDLKTVVHGAELEILTSDDVRVAWDGTDPDACPTADE